MKMYILSGDEYLPDENDMNEATKPALNATN
jgi:hypothetical protein